jgi:hypothetical protein
MDEIVLEAHVTPTNSVMDYRLLGYLPSTVILTCLWIYILVNLFIDHPLPAVAKNMVSEIEPPSAVEAKILGELFVSSIGTIHKHQ